MPKVDGKKGRCLRRSVRRRRPVRCSGLRDPRLPICWRKMMPRSASAKVPNPLAFLRKGPGSPAHSPRRTRQVHRIPSRLLGTRLGLYVRVHEQDGYAGDAGWVEGIESPEVVPGRPQPRRIVVATRRALSAATPNPRRVKGPARRPPCIFRPALRKTWVCPSPPGRSTGWSPTSGRRGWAWGGPAWRRYLPGAWAE